MSKTLARIRNRSQDVCDGYLLGPRGPIKLKYPKIAQVNETVGAYVCGMAVGVACSGLDTNSLASTEEIESIQLPSPSFRRAVGAGINTLVVGVSCLALSELYTDPVSWTGQTIMELIRGNHGV